MIQLGEAINSKTRWGKQRIAPHASSLLGAVLLLPALCATLAHAQAPYPSKPVTLVLATTAGGLADGAIRLMQPSLSELLKQPVIIENRAGAAGVIGATAVARANPDGHTVLLNLEMHVINQVMSSNIIGTGKRM